jgi:hypothetical protein
MKLRALVKVLPRKAEFVGEAAQWGAIAEGVMVPQPHHRNETKKFDWTA